MSTRGIKTVVNTPAAVFAGNSVLIGRTWLRVRNLDDVMNIVVGNQLLEPGEFVEISFVATTPETVMAYSNGRSVSVEVIEA